MQRTPLDSSALWRRTADVHRATYRVFCILAGVLNPLFGAVYQLTDPTVIDPIGGRLVMSVVSLLLLSLSYMAPWVERNFILLVRAYFYLLMVNIVGLTVVNQFTPNYTLGMLFAFTAMGIAFSLGLSRTIAPLVRYLSFNVILTVVAGFVVQEPEVSVWIVWVCAASTALIIYVVANAKITAEESAQVLEHRYQTLMDAASDAILIADPESGMLLDANEKARELLDRTPEEVRRTRLRDLFPEREREHFSELFSAHVFEGKALGKDLFLLGRGSTPIPVDLSASLVDVDGRPIIQTIFRDATERHHYEEQLIQAKERAEELLRLKTSLLNNMSHELRTPLTAILGFAEVLVEEVTDIQREHAGVIVTSARRLRETVNSVLGLAQLESGTPILDLRDLDLAAHLREAVTQLKPLADQKGLALEVRVWARDTFTQADATCLARVVNNLVGNAIKFTEKGSVTVEVDAEGERVLVRVRDTGVGISEEFLPRLFEEFQQESTGHGRSHEGNGLGLAITKRLVELMGGTVTVESHKGYGSTFTVSLPRAEPSAAVEPPRMATILPIRPTERRVLLVEDNPSTRQLVELHLAPLCHLTAVSDPEEALALAARTPYDGFILDINLTASQDGVELLRALRTLPGQATAPAAALTAYAMPEDRERFFRAGFDHYLAKPFEKRHLLQLFLDLFPTEKAVMPHEDIEEVVQEGHFVSGESWGRANG